MTEPRGKLLWDVVALRLAAQAANQTALVGRAKDLLATATIAATILGILLNDKLFGIVKTSPPTWWTGATTIAFVALVGAGVYAMWPREYSFAPDAEDFARADVANPNATVDALYRAMAQGYLEPNMGSSQVGKNQQLLRRLELAVRIESFAIAALALLALSLLLVVESG